MKELTELALKSWGILLTAICGTYLTRPSTCERVLRMMEKEEFVLISGWLSLFLGAPTLALGLKGSWELTATGTIFLVNGVLRLAFPSYIKREVKLFQNRKWFPLTISLFGLIFGLIFLFQK
ncbi:hypothetical protein [Thermovibrio sp.]